MRLEDLSAIVGAHAVAELALRLHVASLEERRQLHHVREELQHKFAPDFAGERHLFFFLKGCNGRSQTKDDVGMVVH